MLIGDGRGVPLGARRRKNPRRKGRRTVGRRAGWVWVGLASWSGRAVGPAPCPPFESEEVGAEVDGSRELLPYSLSRKEPREIRTNSWGAEAGASWFVLWDEGGYHPPRDVSRTRGGPRAIRGARTRGRTMDKQETILAPAAAGMFTMFGHILRTPHGDAERSMINLLIGSGQDRRGHEGPAAQTTGKDAGWRAAATAETIGGAGASCTAAPRTATKTCAWGCDYRTAAFTSCPGAVRESSEDAI